MLLAMGLAAAACIGIGVFPGVLYDLLPFAVDYAPYTTAHVVTQLQLLFFAALAFSTLVRTGIYPPELRSVNLDVDWTYRWLAPRIVGVLARWGGMVGAATRLRTRQALAAWLRVVRRLHSPAGALGEPWPTGTTAYWAALLLVAFLLLTYLEL
jgi:multicomponent Na+:H+ antiporter subunit D